MNRSTASVTRVRAAPGWLAIAASGAMVMLAACTSPGSAIPSGVAGVSARGVTGSAAAGGIPAAPRITYASSTGGTFCGQAVAGTWTTRAFDPGATTIDVPNTTLLVFAADCTTGVSSVAISDSDVARTSSLILASSGIAAVVITAPSAPVTFDLTVGTPRGRTVQRVTVTA